MKKDKKDNLKKTLEDIEKQYGKGTIIQMSEDDYPDIERISTGSIGLDKVLKGGIPRGRITEIFGPESSGKTTLSLHVIANAQKQGLKVSFVDAEHALDVEWASRIGVSIGDLLVNQPDSGEQALNITEALIRSGDIGLIVVDSVAALVPRAEIEGEMGDSHIGLQARLMSQAMRKLSPLVQQTNTAVVFINQIRMKVGISWGNPEVTSGGNALKFYSSLRLDLRRIGKIQNGQDVIGSKTRAKVVKSKVSTPYKQVEFDIIFDEGISQINELIEIAVNKGIIEKAGAWYSYGELRLGQGLENSKQFLKDNEKLIEEIRGKL